MGNNTAVPRSFYLEPWGGQYDVEPGTSLRVEIVGDEAPELLFEFTDDVSILSVLSQSNAVVFDGEHQVIAR